MLKAYLPFGVNGEEAVMAKILIIDNIPEDRLLLRIIIDSQGKHEVLEASNGLEGLNLMNSFSPDIVFCDIKMQPTDGYEFAKSVLDTPAFFGCEVIFYSAHFFDKPAPLEAANEVGVSHVILKTSEPIQMAEAVHSAISRSLRRGHIRPPDSLHMDLKNLDGEVRSQSALH